MLFCLLVLLCVICTIDSNNDVLSSEPTLEPTYMPTPSPMTAYKDDCEQLSVDVSLDTAHNETINEHTLAEIMTTTIYLHYNITIDSRIGTIIDIRFESLKASNDSFMLSYDVTNCDRSISHLYDYLSSDMYQSSLDSDLEQTYDAIIIYNIHVEQKRSFAPLPSSSSSDSLAPIFTYNNALSIVLMCILFILILATFIAYIQNENAYICSRNLGCKMSDNLYLLRVLQFVAALFLVFLANLNTSFAYFTGYAVTHDLPFLICAVVCVFLIALNAIFSGLYAIWYAFHSEHKTEHYKQWLQCHQYKLMILSLLSGSFYGSILLVNSNLFGLDMFSMRLAHEQLHQFQTKNMCSLYLAMSMIAVHGYMLFYLRSQRSDIGGETVSAIVISIVGCLLIIGIQVATRLKHYKHEYETTSIDITIEVDNGDDKLVLQQQRNLTKAMQALLATTLAMNSSDIEVVGSHRTEDGIVVACKIYHRVKIQNTIRERNYSARDDLYEELLLEDQNNVSGISTSDLQRLNTQSAKDVIKKMYYLESPPLTVSYDVSVRTERSGLSRYSRTFTL